MPLVSDEYFKLALKNIAKLGDTDVFPLPFENHVLFDKQEKVLELLQQMSLNIDDELAKNRPRTHSALAPAGYNGYRWVTQIDPLWNAYFLGTTLSLADSIENDRIDPAEMTIFSHRYAPEEHHLFVRDGWKTFQDHSLTLAENAEFVVVTDIADFYSRIYHHRIDNLLGYADPGSEKPKHIMALLTKFSREVSYGLPVGGPASRVLAELLLNDTDKLVKSELSKLENASFVRFADDYRFFVSDIETAYRCIGFLSETLQRNEGLSLQRSKTRIMTRAEYIRANGRDYAPAPGSSARFLNLHLYYDPYSPTAEEDYDTLREQLDEFDVLSLIRAELDKGRVDQGLIKRLVASIVHLAPEIRVQAILSLLENVETLTPVIPHVLRAVAKNVGAFDAEAQERVQHEVRALVDGGHHVVRADVNMAYFVRVLGQTKSNANESTLSQIFKGGLSYSGKAGPDVQREIILTMGRWKSNYWLHGQKVQYDDLHPWAKRAFLVSSYSLGDAGKHWRKSSRHGLSKFDKIVLEWAGEKFNGNPHWTVPS